MAEMMVVQSKVKDFNKSKGFRTSDEFMQALNKAVQDLVSRSQGRCKDEGMGTLKARHC